MQLRVNGEAVRNEVVAREAESVRRRLEQLSAEQREKWGLNEAEIRAKASSWARENVVEQVLLRQAAEKESVSGELVAKRYATMLQNFGGPDKLAEAGVDEASLRSDIERQLKVERLVARLRSKARAPKPKELAQTYRRNKERYKTAEMVRAAHIVKHVEKDVTDQQARAAADRIYAELQAGATFESLADQWSDCPGGGGDLGYFPRGKMVKEFEDVVFGMAVGDTSQVFKTSFGYHIAKLLDRKAPGVRPFAEVRDEIRKELLEARRTKLVEKYVDSLRAAAQIEGLDSPPGA